MKIFQKFKKFFKREEELIVEEDILSDSDNEFYSIIKLVSGEELFSLVMIEDHENDPTLVLQNPIIIKTVSNSHGSFVKVKPWITTSDDDIFIVKLDKIITMTETKDEKLINIYNSYLHDVEIDIQQHSNFSSSGLVKPSLEMGYVTSVREARIVLERIYKDLKES